MRFREPFMMTSATCVLAAARTTSALYCASPISINQRPIHKLSGQFGTYSEYTTTTRLSASKKRKRSDDDALVNQAVTEALELPLPSPAADRVPEFATTYHAPVMWKECIDALLGSQRSGNGNLRFIDGTLGGGGHSLALLQHLQAGDVVFGSDVDPEALAAASERLCHYMNHDGSEKPLFVPVESNFRNLASKIPQLMHPVKKDELVLPQDTGVDGILLDLGVSSHQIDTAERGFAFLKDGPLDMRMQGRSGGLTAADILNEFSQDEIRRILKQYGDEPRAKAISQSIIDHLPISTTSQLVDAVAAVVPEFAKQGRRQGRKATLARVFQSLRIVVNQEDSVLREALEEMCPTLVRPGGRLAVLSYHSMEDRAAKRIMRDGTTGRRPDDERDVYGNYIGVPKPWKTCGKAQKASDEEVEINSRARSATLRVAERVGN